MPKLTYIPSKFKNYMGPNFTSTKDLTFSWAELCRAAITVGRKKWRDVIKHGTYSVLEILWRIAMVRANLVENSDGRLRKSTSYISLDPSEKGAVSFFFGMCFAKLLAEKLLAVPWLLHLDVYKQQLNSTFNHSERPDFVGMDTANNWLVVEAKGRTGFAPQGLLDKTKRQTRSLRKINGQKPVLRVVSASYFSSNCLGLKIQDPEKIAKGATDIDVKPEDLAKAYYAPIVDCLKQSSSKEKLLPNNDNSYHIAELPGMDAKIGLDSRIFYWHQEKKSSWKRIAKTLKTDPSILEEITAMKGVSDLTRPIRVNREKKRITEIRLVGLDGIFVELGKSWNETLMRMEPQDRI